MNKLKHLASILSLIFFLLAGCGQQIVDTGINKSDKDITEGGQDFLNFSENEYIKEGFKKYTNNRLGFSVEIPERYILSNEFGENQSSNSERALELELVFFQDPRSLNSSPEKSDMFYFKILNSTDEEKIKIAGGWNTIEKVDERKLGQYMVKIFSINNGSGEMRVVSNNGRSYLFQNYLASEYHLSEEEFDKIITSLKFINQ